MYGKTKREVAYYVCAPKKAYLPPGHPPATFWVREDHLLDGLSRSLTDRVFGAYRHQLLGASLACLDEQARQEQAERLSALRRQITEVDTKIKNLVHSLELAEDIDGDLLRDITARRAELHARRKELHRELADSEDEIHHAPKGPARRGRTPGPPVRRGDV